ncbi:uncharacterized protein NFIA_092690 [Aspergillus fischeri NRRL 181]|uniref:Uncharacterized protein n=1 Tax=Neosartorya fischeri (strain ATCC 1020 / DSM 3700 / CBS 544.65 / FGSC A1164 / JCM 1740 / NRRL 181 / WB 181) TaxID=331117 RepID=A1DIV1_NEOFI|nr:uncharacterized protein NFIA_092690 [Aspergillus fischeri NRRL 181]EAW19308.1 hypothetical protein NFIA_092690 [Aspergillus fischeri NRRL 181]
MSAHHYNDIRRDGFISAFGRFMTDPGRMDRIAGSQLRSMFLPKLSREGQKALRDNPDFVRHQLKHYGVQFEEREFTGKGTALMKAALQAGKCDQVPDHIMKLQKQMHADWISERSPEQLSSHPDWVMQKYFLSADQPDRTKTTTVIGIPLDRHSQYRSGQMIEAASKITGLHHMRAFGPKAQVIFMEQPWRRQPISPVEEARRIQDEEDERENEREQIHMDYLNSLSQQTEDVTPVGTYIVDSETIEREYPDMAGDLSLDIHRTDTPGVFKADFDFGILEGVMIICSEKFALDEYCAQADRDDESDWNDSMDEEGSEEETDDEDSVPTKRTVKLGAKRNPPASKPMTRPKKYKAGQDQARKFLLKLKCREMGEGVIHFQASKGTINFKDKNFASFEGVADFPGVGQGVSFFARKISDLPCPSGNDWADYSERQYEIERVRRWH